MRVNETQSRTALSGGISKNWQVRLNAYQTSDPARQYKKCSSNWKLRNQTITQPLKCRCLAKHYFWQYLNEVPELPRAINSGENLRVKICNADFGGQTINSNRIGNLYTTVFRKRTTKVLVSTAWHVIQQCPRQARRNIFQMH